MVKTMWCETFNFARSLRCLQRQGSKCFARISLIFFDLAETRWFFCKKKWPIQSENPCQSLQRALLTMPPLWFSGRSLYLRPFHWRLGSCFRCIKSEFQQRDLSYSIPLYEVHVGTLSPTWCAKQSDCEMWKPPNKSQEYSCLCLFNSLYIDDDTFPGWGIVISDHLWASLSCPVHFLSHFFSSFQALQVQESQPKVLFTDLPPLWFLPVKESPKDASTILKIFQSKKKRGVRGNWRK